MARTRVFYKIVDLFFFYFSNFWVDSLAVLWLSMKQFMNIPRNICCPHFQICHNSSIENKCETNFITQMWGWSPYTHGQGGVLGPGFEHPAASNASRRGVPESRSQNPPCPCVCRRGNRLIRCFGGNKP